MGLTTSEVENHILKGEINTGVNSSDLTLKDIIRENVLTYFNLIFLIIAVCLCVVRSYRGLTFLPVIIANTLIGIVQEWRSKKLLDRLRIVTDPKVKVIRDGKETQIASVDLVLDDLVILEAGNQIPADARLESGELQVNEALLTGEADEIIKKAGSELLSGSFVVSGSGKARLIRVGKDSYSNQLTLEAKARKKGEQSEMIRSLDKLVKIIGILIIPIAGILFTQQYRINHATLKDAVTSTAAAVLGMIPEGLYLLASVAMAVSVMRLAMSKVLVHNMKSIETLARVDVLCVDKTGTITENTMTVKRAIPLAGMHLGGSAHTSLPLQSEEEKREEEEIRIPDQDYLEEASDVQEPEVVEEYSSEDLTTLELMIGDFASCMGNDNSTIKAVKTYFSRQTGKRPESVIPFSPVYKYSGAVFAGKSYVFGAPEFILRSDYPVYAGRIEQYTMYGYRVLVFAEYLGTLSGEALTERVLPLGLVLLHNPVRENAAETFRYFAQQGVTVKVISGDNPMTVSEVAVEAGIEGADRFVDASALDEADMPQAVQEYTVFGRVTPQQKRQLIAALKKNGHTVAMTGDGVNDVLALKDADCSIAMASGSDAAAHAAQMVLLESDFSKMPAVVTEGRRVVNNIERTASLFLVKNIFSLLMSIFSIIFLVNYPFEPSQISLISMFTIGIPAFFMSLETNRGQIKGHFMSNVFFRALPAGLTDFAVISSLVLFCREFDVGGSDLSTSCTILLAIVGIMILYRIASPMTRFHWILWFSMILGIILCMIFLNRIFAINMISGRCAMLLVLFAIVTEPLLRYLSLLIRKIWDLCSWVRNWIARRREEQEKLFADLM